MNIELVKWLPRFFGVCFALFLLFSVRDNLDLRTTTDWANSSVFFAVTIAVVLGWIWPLVGAIVFFLIGLATIVLFGGGVISMTAPCLVIGGLFLLRWRLERRYPALEPIAESATAGEVDSPGMSATRILVRQIRQSGQWDGLCDTLAMNAVQAMIQDGLSDRQINDALAKAGLSYKGSHTLLRAARKASGQEK